MHQKNCQAHENKLYICEEITKNVNYLIKLTIVHNNKKS